MGDKPDREQRMYGLWPSPVSSKHLAGVVRLGEPCWDSDGMTLGWVEGRSDRGVIVVQEQGGAPRDLTPAGFSVRAFVGYGGGDFTLSGGVCFFVNQDDQRIYRQPLAGGAPRPITPAFGAASSPAVSPDGRFILYVHTYEDIDCIALVDSEGQDWPVRLAEGRDFYMQPSWHPSSARAAWVEWDHPRMPWDGTELRLANLSLEGNLPEMGESAVVAGGPDTAIFQPGFTADGKALIFISDETGFGQLYRRDLGSGETTMLTDGEGEYGTPAWNHGMRRWAINRHGDVVAVRSHLGVDEMVLVSRWGTTRTLSGQWPEYQVFSAPAGSSAAPGAASIAAGGAQPSRVVVFDGEATGGPWLRVVRRSDPETIPAAALSRPGPVTWTSFDGEEAHGIYFPPASASYEGSGPAPLVVLVHGGPTSQVTAGWNNQAQFFATRGYGVLFPNYRGSTGYGRDYMLKLRQSWGIYDVEDSRTGALALTERGLADPTKLVIMGGSAGGYTVLQSLVTIPGFYKAAVCMFGVANMFTLASDTHKFEARYLDSMLGPLPEAAAVYRERSPIFHADRIVDPIAVFQGDIDRVVPREQSDSIVASLRARGVTHEYHVYEGEGHGWRKSETIDHFWAAVERFLRTHVLFA